MFDTRSHLQRLIEDLERDIREKPDRRFAELAALRAALSAIAGEDTPAKSGLALAIIDADQIQGVNSRDPVRRHVTAQQVLREGSKKLAFREMVQDLLSKRSSHRVHRSDIIIRCHQLKMFGETKDLDRDVSKYLSTDGTFAPDGDGYWKTKDTEGTEVGP